MLSFYSFPQEIQQMILSKLAQSRDLASFACVHKHWQEFFEAKTFRHLIISQYDIEDFEIVVQGARRSYVKHLWLRILLPKYLWVWRKEEEDEHVLWKADRIFTTSIFDFWEVLAKWDACIHGGNSGFTFELSAHSPSDWGKHVRDDFFERDVDMYQEYLETDSTKAYKSSGDVYVPYLKAYWGLGGMFGTQMWDRTVADLFGWKPLEFNFREQEDMSPIREDEAPELPSVSVIAKFLIRRSQFRQISPASLVETLSSLPHLEQLAIERWRCLDAQEETLWCQMAKAFILDLPTSVKTLSLYGDTANIFHEWSSRDVMTIGLAKQLRNYGRHLESISISCLIDAKDFFQPFWTSRTECTTTWENFKTLSLTSQILKSSSRSRVNGLLCAAANTAMKMPKLQLLELWNGDEGMAFVFRYRVKDTVTEITWLSTHIPKVDQKVINAWTSVAVAQGRPDVRVSIGKLDPDKIISTGTVLRYLYLREQILHAVSAYRIAWEQKKQS
ncbi:hypothetical protein NW755_007089 [Fusarium falciforme]|uniref:F-box domain-containing protein n=1 Tax=Fusarium falciforme TaxID=195108 RepID=A0A9W8UZ78_9HYPO|nr:hypothetical protein NW755_007089 [Fusarium falciforme]